MKRNVLLVGASSGIGLSLHQQLKEEGLEVYTLGRQIVPGGNHQFFDASASGELTIPDSWPAEFHTFIYCPGTIQLKPIQRLSRADFLQDFEVNVLGFVQVLQAILPRLKKAQGASVVVFSTVATQVGLGFHASVSASKGALESLALSLAAELAPAGIRVNVIAPSLTDTPLAGSLLNTPEKREAAGKRHPLGRFGSAEEIAAAARFLTSSEASWITGQVLTIDGGLSRLR
jgi:NAD(P)-dependent dehydrogenase (short-subunit alcohol dehydrogenase family)